MEGLQHVAVGANHEQVDSQQTASQPKIDVLASSPRLGPLCVVRTMPRQSASRGRHVSGKGAEFEHQVELLYRSMGSSVVPNVRLSGQQFDLIAEKPVVGGIRIRMAIECKYLSRGNVSNQAVLDFIHAYNVIRDKQRFTHGTLITNAGFSADAKSIPYDSL